MSTVSNSTGPSDADIEEFYTSEFEIRKIQLNWTIPDLEFTFKNVQMIESPRFPSTKSEKVKWYIQLLPTKLKEGNEEKMQMYLKNTDNKEQLLKANVFYFDSSREITAFSNNYDNFGLFNPNTSWSKSGDELYKLMLNEKKKLPKNMTIVCKITFVDSGKNVPHKTIAIPLKSEGIMKQTEYFFDDQIFKDVKFVVEEKEFSAHKSILALRSPVFAAMFKSKMSEDLSSVVEIKDIKSRIFQTMLRFIYTDQVQDLEECAIELFYAAEKYQLDRLKELCINSLCNSMSVETVVKILEFADIFSILKLKNKALAYLVSCLKIVQESEDFLNLLESRPLLAVRIIQLQTKQEATAKIIQPRKNCDSKNKAHEVLSQDMEFELRL